eukprot:CAMPEP_0174370934 /NCGR_PEP_ID=MMETSP0811_2-20130205/97917_1 /TAXON_ID=73025 ORGANISM="Eutreptiella gymnastica-like, Strain CCMP1594" /NCGR_SAMPLE_ID=MMETSP0811_2 /ASSEMBLY_ACC=CAM_ASM_000667 /LENGTH=197 /DNA_ID=CAMNT_0015516841 /DNA_START=269 /DNA_END=863 /DNA_ORIENTATION=-
MTSPCSLYGALPPGPFCLGHADAAEEAGERSSVPPAPIMYPAGHLDKTARPHLLRGQARRIETDGLLHTVIQKPVFFLHRVEDRSSPRGPKPFASLKGKAALYDLTAELSWTGEGANGAQALAELKGASASASELLRKSQADACYGIAHPDSALVIQQQRGGRAQAFAGLSDAAALHALALGLPCNGPGRQWCPSMG